MPAYTKGPAKPRLRTKFEIRLLFGANRLLRWPVKFGIIQLRLIAAQVRIGESSAVPEWNCLLWLQLREACLPARRHDLPRTSDRHPNQCDYTRY